MENELIVKTPAGTVALDLSKAERGGFWFDHPEHGRVWVETLTLGTDVVDYSPDLDIRNMDALPRGTGAKYLVAIPGLGSELVAKRWARVPKVGKGEILIRFGGAK